MKSLRETRQNKNLSLIDLNQLTNTAPITLSLMERGVHTPKPIMRKRIGRILGFNINYLDVPTIKIDPIQPPADWMKCERKFRYLIRCIASLPEDERKAFVQTAGKHLQALI